LKIVNENSSVAREESVGREESEFIKPPSYLSGSVWLIPNLTLVAEGGEVNLAPESQKIAFSCTAVEAEPFAATLAYPPGYDTGRIEAFVW
jgi:hypothetical protein